jgi:hypothetical protein
MSGGTVAPGNSAGTLTVDRLTASSGVYQWELAALSTSNPGVDFDRIVVNNQANLSETALLTINFTGTATDPNAGDPFWNTARQWAIIDSSGGAVIGNYGTITNAIWSTGSFSLTNTGTQLSLSWTPVPEPSVFGAAAVLAGVSIYRRRRKQSN